MKNTYFGECLVTSENNKQEQLIPKCNNIEELLDKLSSLGYQIRRGKYIAVKSVGMEKFARINTINTKYSYANLNKYYKQQDYIKLIGIKTHENEFNSALYQKANESKIAIEKSQLGAQEKYIMSIKKQNIKK